MASVFQRDGRWYLRVKDQHGRWTKVLTSARTKTEARLLALEVERRNDRQRLGLEPLAPADGGGTLAELLRWWLATVSAGSPSHEWSERTVTKHLLSSELASLPLVAVSAERIEAFLHRKAQEELAPQTVNHLRAFLSRAFNAARRMGRYLGSNPVALVQKRRVPKALRDILKPEEVGPVLVALAPRWRPLFVTAVYTGLRKGELLGLRKTDVDLRRRLLAVARSYDRDTTKGGHADVIPIAAELVPYLERALETSPSALLFPAEDGSMMRADSDLEKVLRRAMGRAGIVTGYKHVCRRPRCGYSEQAPDAELRRCPRDNAKLWPRPQVRPLRFHDLRHTTGSLLMMAGANPAAVQRILRHSDPRLTTERYGHLAPNYLRAEVDRLTFGSFVPPLSPGASPETTKAGSTEENSQQIRPFITERRTGFEPATPSLGSSCSLVCALRRQAGGVAGVG